LRGAKRRSNLGFPPETPSVCFAPLATTEGGLIARTLFGASLRGPFSSVIARSAATKQSRLIPRRSPPGGPSGCFAPLATTEEGVIARGFLGLSSRGSFFLVIARSIATKQSRLIPRRSPPRPPQFASLRSQRQKGECHCEERSDEAISFLPREAPEVASLRSQRRKGGVLARSVTTKQSRFLPGRPPSLLRCARNDRRGRHCEERSDEAISLHYPPHLQISSYKSSHLGFMLSINRTLLSLLPPLICFSLLMASEISSNTS